MGDVMKKVLNTVLSILLFTSLLFVFGCASNENVEDTRNDEILVEPVATTTEDTPSSKDFYYNFIIFFNGGKPTDIESLEQVLKSWEEFLPQDPDLYTAKFNYSYYKALNSETENDLYVNVSSAISYLQDALELYPDRLDIWFGLITFSQKFSIHNLALDVMTGCIEQSKVNNHKWLWTLNEPASYVETSLEDKIDEFLWNFHNYITYWLEEASYASHEAIKNIVPKLLELNPNHVVILNDIAYCHLNLGEVEEAKVYLLKAHEVAPKDYIVAGNLAYLAFNEGDYDTSLKYIEILTSCDDPKYVEHGNNLLEKINSKRL